MPAGLIGCKISGVLFSTSESAVDKMPAPWLRILRPGFFMENFDGFLGSIAVALLHQGLGKDTTIAVVVCRTYDIAG